jgi:FtsZ-binding cell division protein ZapB
MAHKPDEQNISEGSFCSPSTPEAGPRTSSPEIDRLNRWRHFGDGPATYTAGSKQFGDDVIVALIEIERLKEVVSRLHKERREAKAEIERLAQSVAQSITELTLTNERLKALLGELRAEVERLQAVEKAAQAAYDYHMTGYNAADDFDANTQIELMDALGRALEPKPDLRALLPELAVIAQVMKDPKP